MNRNIGRLAALTIFKALESPSGVFAWVSVFPSAMTSLGSFSTSRQITQPSLNAKKAGSFFNQVPEDSGDGKDGEGKSKQTDNPLENLFSSKSTGKGFGNKPAASIQRDSESNRPYVGIGPASVNDVTKPEYDNDGYTLYTDETTGEKSRVFDALVDYPCKFTLKIVGANEGSFVQDMIEIVQTTCEVEEEIVHSVKVNGKWTSVTVEAPVVNAEMLYQLYENVDRDPRVKFKF